MEEIKNKIYLYGETGILSSYTGPVNLVEISYKGRKHFQGGIDTIPFQDPDKSTLTPYIIEHICLGYQIILDKNPKKQEIPLKEEYKKNLEKAIENAIQWKWYYYGQEGLENLKEFQENFKLT